MYFYDILETIGKGTFGTVYLCARKHNQQKIVIKEITTELKGDDLKTAKNEVHILKSLNDPNIIKYFDSFSKNDNFYIVMEYANQGTLFEFISNSKPEPLKPQIVMNLFCQILMGLDHIHEKKVIHRDLKCENIFLTGNDKNVVKIGDFGISKLLVSNRQAKTIIGTCNYLAPELCGEKPYDKKVDIWSLGCILYELCAAEKMFEGSLINVIMSIVNGRLKSVNKNIYGEQMQDMIALMLRINPEDRPDTKQLMSLPDIFPTLHLLGTSLGNIMPLVE